MLVLRPVRL
jgi:hypothetical protein